MGSGMLWAAIGGGAKAYDQVLDGRMKREEEERKRQLSISDRRNELLYEMKLKSDWANQEETRNADAGKRIAERGEQITNERGARELDAAKSMVPGGGEFANDRITPEMIAEMPPQARAIYEKEMGLTDDSTLQRLRDQVTASSEVPSPASVKKGVLESYREEAKSEKDRLERERKEKRDEDLRVLGERKLDQRDAQIAQQAEIADKRLAAIASRVGGSGRDQGIGEVMKYVDGKRKDLKDDQAAAMKAMGSELSGARGSTQKEQIRQAYKPKFDEIEQKRRSLDSDYNSVRERIGLKPAASEGPAPKTFAPESTNRDDASSKSSTPLARAQGDLEAIEREIARAQSSTTVSADAKATQVRMLEAERSKTKAMVEKLAGESTKKDNQSSVSAPVKVQSKTQYDALPKGARYVAPDGSIRTKG